MVQITLPDGSLREFAQPVTVAEVAASIGAGLAKAALGGKVDGQLVDLSLIPLLRCLRSYAFRSWWPSE